MSTFDPTNAGQGSNRERPEPGDPEAQFYQNSGAADDQTRQHHTGYGPGWQPGMDPDGFAHQQGGWQGRPGWQPWAGGGFYYRRRRFPIWGILLAIVLVALLIKPALTFTFALAGLAFVILAFLLPFLILALILNHFYGGNHWGGGPGRWRGW